MNNFLIVFKPLILARIDIFFSEIIAIPRNIISAPTWVVGHHESGALYSQNG